MKQTIAIFGAGQSGQAARRLAHSLGQATVLYDEGGQGDAADFFTADCERFDAFVFSPGFAEEHPWRRAAVETRRPCLSELAFAAAHWRGPLIGITGTNGKTTLTQLLASALGALDGQPGRPCASVAAGNIGYPLADTVLSHVNRESTVAVLEISSFQAELSQSLRLDGLLWTNFAEDHLDRYLTMEAYFEAKAQLFDCLKPGAPCFVGPQVVPWIEQGRRAGQAYRQAEADAELLNQLPADSAFRRAPNRENFSLAASWWQQRGLPIEVLVRAAGEFRPAAHRLEFVAEVGGVRFWDDSKATNFHAALAAIESIDRPLVWIGGGRAKGGDVAAFARAVAAQVDEVVLYGEAASAMVEAMCGCGVPVVRQDSFADAVRAAAGSAASLDGAHVLLSPGFASFDQFRSYRERGKSFRELVLGLKRGR